jgi:hypothetical protein
MTTRNKPFVLLIILFGVMLFLGATAAASSFINAQNPETARQNTPLLVPPMLAPPGTDGYIEQSAGERITAMDERPVAQLRDPTAAGVGASLAVNFPDLQLVNDEDTIYYAVLASIRYSGEKHTVLVTTARPSADAAQIPTAFGSETIRLVNGQSAWVSKGSPGDLPNKVVFLQGDLIITVASDLDLQKMSELAAQVVVEAP